MINRNDIKPSRKQNRLDFFDYASAGAYFITVCTLERKNYFWSSTSSSVGASIARPQDIKLSLLGEVVDSAINKIPQIYPTVSLLHYVVMPDHIHVLLSIDENSNGRPMVAPTINITNDKNLIANNSDKKSDLLSSNKHSSKAPTVSRIVQQLKGYVTKKLGYSIWQKLFFDHIIRNSADLNEHLTYIDENPISWLLKTTGGDT